MPRRRRRSPLRPVITLLTDFGLSDSYVAEMKGVLYSDRGRLDPAIVDITHGIRPQDMRAGSFVLERALRAFAEGTIHIAVVDPGVGSPRRLLVARINRQLVLAPDNGLITWAYRRLPHERVYELVWRPAKTPSATFHGRDILAPAALKLAQGTPVARIARPIDAPVLLDIHPATPPVRRATILHIDHFGNATTNAPAEAISLKAVKVGNKRIPFVRTYADVPEGQPLALIGSSGLLEIAVRNGHAANTLKLTIGDQIPIIS
jgi:S-adenosylmethionine hydrolase